MDKQCHESLPSNEEWKVIKGFDNYLISNLGRVMNIRTGRVLKNSFDGEYYKVELRRDCKGYTRRVHRLVAEAFIPNDLGKPQVNHISGVKTNNRAINLEWCTSSENTQHAYDIGLISLNAHRGENHPKSKVTSFDVLNIRKLYSLNTGVKDISKLYNISPSNVYHIVSRRSWKHI